VRGFARILFALLRHHLAILYAACLYVVSVYIGLVSGCDVRHNLTFPQYDREMLTILTFD
jgi:hypothetical protein